MYPRLERKKAESIKGTIKKFLFMDKDRGGKIVFSYLGISLSNLGEKNVSPILRKGWNIGYLISAAPSHAYSTSMIDCAFVWHLISTATNHVYSTSQTH